MPIQKTEAIVLKRTEFRETSLIATFYTRDFGKIRGIIKGIRCKENRHDSHLDLGSVNWIVFYEKPRSELYLVSQVELKQIWHGLVHQLDRILLAQVVLEEMDLLTPLHEPSNDLYTLLYKTIGRLSNECENDPSVQKILHYFESQMLFHFGVKPQLERCLSCQRTIDRDAWISFAKGGVLCGECHEQEIFADPISQETLVALLQLADEALIKGLEVSSTLQQQIGNILRGFI